MNHAISRSVRAGVLAALAILLLGVALPWFVAPLIAARVRALAHARGLEAHWDRLRFSWPLTVELRGLALRRGLDASPVVSADRVEVSLGPRGLSLRPRISRLVLDHAHVVLPTAEAGDDTTTSREDERAGRGGPASPRVRAAAQQVADALLLPARRLPELRLTDLDIQRGDSLFARLDALALTHRSGGLQFAVTGVLASERRVPFDMAFQWNADDRLVGRAGFQIPDGARRSSALELRVDGSVRQDRRSGVLEVREGTHVHVGGVELRVSGEVRRAGPRFRAALEADGLTAPEIQRSLPSAMLGPLSDMSLRGSWDWRASLDVDVSQPDSAHFTARVIPHGLALGEAGARLRLGRLAVPFLAEIHVPKGIVYRDLSSVNPNFRPLERISPLLRDALLTNEDGSFYQHRGFNTGAIELAMAANLRSGSLRRGAGTVTMQLARNLFLGHQRTLSRKGQEVVLAWVLEHLTGLSKDRLLEIYLNIIEWGPAVHGANEAARFYFDRDAADVTLDEALFLTVLVPSPGRWRTRLDANGELRPWARSQMAFIARKMAARGWLAPEQVPEASALHIRLRGGAAEAFAPRDSSSASPGDSTISSPETAAHIRPTAATSDVRGRAGPD